jgi:tetratricopeptide (TPR) repeat protein
LDRLARILEARGNFQEAANKYRDSAARFNMAHSSFKIATLHHSQGDYVTAGGEYRHTEDTADDIMAPLAIAGYASLLRCESKTDQLDHSLLKLQELLSVGEYKRNQKRVLQSFALANLSTSKEADLRKAIELASKVADSEGMYDRFRWPIIAKNVMVAAYARLGELQDAIRIRQSVIGEPASRESMFRQFRVLTTRDAEDAVINAILEAGNVLDVEKLYREGLHWRAEELPPNHADIAFTKQKLAALLVEQSRYDEAEPLLLEAFELLKDHPIAPKARAQETLDQIVELYERWDKPKELAKWKAISVD